MNPWKPTKVEWITFFALMPILDVVLNSLLFGRRLFRESDIWKYSFPIIFVQGFTEIFFLSASLWIATLASRKMAVR